MNKIILVLFVLACVGCAIAGYGSGTPGYYDPWTYYGGYDRYYNNRYNYGRNQPRPYYPISRYGGGSGSSYSSSDYNRLRPYNSASRYNNYASSSSSYSRPSYGRSGYNRVSYNDDMMGYESY